MIKAITTLLLIVYMALFLAGCAEKTPETTGMTRFLSFTYVLQAEKLGKNYENTVEILADSQKDFIVLDPFYYDDDGSKKWEKKDLDYIRSKKGGRKLVAYLSIGEAENYRSYWQKDWDTDEDGKPDSNAPSFLCDENPGWEGNYKVKYWKKEWQDIIFKEVTQIMNQGFDGVWLDIVDGFEFFEQEGNRFIDYRINPETKNSFRKDMVLFVAEISKKVKASCLQPNPMIVPQNGAQLLEIPEYRKVISAIALEDLYTVNDSKQPESHTHYIKSFLQLIKDKDIPIFVTEYCTSPDLSAYVFENAEKNGFVPLITNRELTVLGDSQNSF